MKKISQFLLLAVAFLCTTVMMSQVTSSSMTGQVTDTEGPVMGATVVATHTPSGSIYGAITNDQGRFNLPGMRVGGPYSIEVSYIGYGKNTTNNIMIRLGAAYIHNVVLSEENVSLDEVVISAKRTKFSAEKTGATTNISNEQMSTMPTINRSISDIARISPYANGMSIAGGDGRSTNFTVDGSNFNNNFGLSSSLPGGGNPISLDAIEEVQVVIAPFDVRQTNFIGGGINAITKSGTNTFKGSAYTYYNNQEMRGNRIGDTDFGARNEESTTTYGATFGGPIIKNKLFFFVNAESVVRPGQVVNWRPSEDGVANLDLSLSRTSIADMERVKQHLITNYGYNPGSYSDYPADETNKKLLARIDWNINPGNKLSVRYNYVKNQGWNATNGNSNNAGSRNRSMDRISQNSMAFSNSTYSMDNIVNSISFDLNSRISDKISNQFLATYSKIQDARGTNSSPFPFIDIMNGLDGSGNQIDEPYMSAGYELFTWNNAVNNNTFTATNNLTYYLDNHKITAGVSFEHQLANNSYMRNGTGYYRYASIDDFLNEAAPRDFALTYGYDGEENPNAEVAFSQLGFYLQDEWNINPDFKLSFGVRADYLKYKDNLIRNNSIYDLDFGGRQIDSGKWPDANVQFSPRVGFTWDVKGDQTMKLRGGTGIFSGRLPLVFFTNMPTNSGMVQGSYAATTTYNADGSVNTASPALAGLAGPMITDVNEMIDRLNLPNTISPEDGVLPRDINGVASDFKMPQVWKTALALDFEVPASFPLSVTLEGIYTKNINGVMLKNYNIEQPDATWQRFSGPDDRYMYPDNSDITYTSTDAYVLSNTSKGWGAISNITVNAQPIQDLRLMAAYTYTESKEISGMPGSNAGSAYSGLAAVNGPHLPELQRSQYVVPSKAIASASYKLPWSNNTLKSATLINLFYSGYSPNGYSYTYTNDMNGDGITTDLIYIPSAKGDINFTSTADEDAFFAFMEQDKYLSANKGKYAEANAARSPWVHSFDLRLAREYYIGAGETKNTLQFTLDFINAGNMLNSEWGVEKNNNISNRGQILRYEGVDGNNVPSYSFVQVAGEYPVNTYDYNYFFGQTWKLQVGVKYSF
ncbi:carboxypeptidase regulatory-like domain-containing protein [Cellulophaga sp. F20128]|uniref:TonB-dependent receptor n=1 Tax=Cellulophaga sp. F20128 TaxID=2926413 RepID=UPI001FF4D4D9|nr:carboxypeptidase regulatory-like domain-containing protein [Cellulophaga sp. F20128]MCK0157434.1 carboxypeptidase regulatory-like domain-containing protein [Cellulophaga sp. F20128]